MPVSKTNSDNSKARPPMTRQCATAIKNKHRKWMTHKYNRTDSNFKLYKGARTFNKVSLELRKAKYSYEKDLALKIKDNNKLFWSYVRSKTKTKYQ